MLTSEELSKHKSTIIDAYKSGDYDAGYNACHAILDEKVDDQSNFFAQSNLIFYVKPLTSYISASYKKIEIRTLDFWSLFNPTIIKDRNGSYDLFVRSSNYVIDDCGKYIFNGKHKSLTQSVYYRSKLDKNMNISNVSILGGLNIWSTCVNVANDWSSWGWEDIRAYRKTFCDKMYGTSSVRFLEKDGTIQVVELEIDDTGVVGYKTLSPISNGNTTAEKNWMPIVDEDCVQRNGEFMYSCSTPVCIKTNEKYILKKNDYKHRHYRGGTQLIRMINGDYIGLVHMVSHDPAKFKRKYFHKFMVFDSEFNLKRLTKEFFFGPDNNFKFPQIEFASGMVKDDDDLIVTFGVEDTKAYIAKLSFSELMSNHSIWQNV